MKPLSTLSSAVFFIASGALADHVPVPRGDDHVESVHLFELPGKYADIEAAIAQPEAVYVAVEVQNEKFEGDPWLWRIDADGKKVWETKLPREKEGDDAASIIGLLPRVDGGARAVVAYLGSTAIVDVTAEGKIGETRTIADVGRDVKMLGLTGGDLLFLGGGLRGKDNEVYVWVARCTPAGKLRWTRRFNPGKDDALYGGTPFLGDSIVFVGVTGEFNKFGQGPSKLWILRLDAKGKKLKETFIDGAGTFPQSTQKIAAAGNELLVPYSRSQLPPIAEVDVTAPMNFDARIARFDANLKLIADVETPPTSMPGATTISTGPPFFSTAGTDEGVIIRCLDAQAKELWKSTINVEDGMARPLFTVIDGGKVTIVCNYSWFTEKQVLPVEYLMLVTMKQR